MTLVINSSLYSIALHTIYLFIVNCYALNAIKCAIVVQYVLQMLMILGHRLHGICSVLSDCCSLFLLYSRIGHPSASSTPRPGRPSGLPWFLVQKHRDELLVVDVPVAVNVGFANEFLALFFRQLVSERGENLEEIWMEMHEDICKRQQIGRSYRVCLGKLLSWHCYEAVALTVENSERLPNLFFDVSVLIGL